MSIVETIENILGKSFDIKILEDLSEVFAAILEAQREAASGSGEVILGKPT